MGEGIPYIIIISQLLDAYGASSWPHLLVTPCHFNPTAWWLLLQAILFYLPSLIWHGLNSKAGVDADSILAAAHTFSRTDRVENRDRTLKMLVRQMDRFLSSRRDVARPSYQRGRFNCSCIINTYYQCSGRRWVNVIWPSSQVKSSQLAFNRKQWQSHCM